MVAVAADFRISCSLFEHPKWLRLEGRLGEPGALCLLKLWSWTRQNRPNGDLAGLCTYEVEHAARWRGEKGELVAALQGIGWIDGAEESWCLHDWHDHQGYATGSAARSRAGKVGAIIKQCRRLGVTPDEYFEDCGGAASRDSRLRQRVQEAYDRSANAKGKGSNRSASAKGGRQAHGVSRSDRTSDGSAMGVRIAPVAKSPISDPNPDPDPYGGEGGEESRPGAGSTEPPPRPAPKYDDLDKRMQRRVSEEARARCCNASEVIADWHAEGRLDA